MISFNKNTKRVVSLLCVLAAIFAFITVPAYADEEPIDFGQFYGVVDSESLNVRAYASKDAPVIAELNKYAAVRVNWIEPEWVCVAYNNDGLMGYVSADYISIFEGDINSAASSEGQAAVNIASQFLGVPYVWGGTTPSGFDCSGLMQYVYRQMGYNLSRTTYTQINEGTPVSRENLQPGDLIFFGSPSSPSHVGMYAGNGMMIHAPHTGDVVKYASIDSDYYRSQFAGARRIFH